MKTNESTLDRVLRVVFGLLLLVLFFLQVLTGTPGVISVIIGAMLLITGLVGFCPLYTLLKIKTNK